LMQVAASCSGKITPRSYSAAAARRGTPTTGPSQGKVNPWRKLIEWLTMFNRRSERQSMPHLSAVAALACIEIAIAIATGSEAGASVSSARWADKMGLQTVIKVSLKRYIL
jgi:hypothetical protein